jgi:hypothetical protein
VLSLILDAELVYGTEFYNNYEVLLPLAGLGPDGRIPIGGFYAGKSKLLFLGNCSSFYSEKDRLFEKLKLLFLLSTCD